MVCCEDPAPLRSQRTRWLPQFPPPRRRPGLLAVGGGFCSILRNGVGRTGLSFSVLLVLWLNWCLACGNPDLLHTRPGWLGFVGMGLGGCCSPPLPSPNFCSSFHSMEKGGSCCLGICCLHGALRSRSTWFCVSTPGTAPALVRSTPQLWTKQSGYPTHSTPGVQYGKGKKTTLQ